MNILGISCFYHDSAAALVVDGNLMAAASEERFSRIKQDSDLPAKAVQFCLDRAQLKINDINYIVFYDKPITKFDRILTGYMSVPFRALHAFRLAIPVWLRRKLWTDHVIHKELEYEGEVLYLPHHLSHASGAFFGSPFEEAAILTVDGVGEWATASFGVGRNNRVELLAQMNYPHSVGLLYSAFTYYLGFQVNSAEYKVMGLAPYGRPVYQDLIEKEIVTIHDDGSIHLHMNCFNFHHGMTMTGKRMERLFGQPRRTPETQVDKFHEDIAASIQAVTENIMVKMAEHVREKTGLNKLCMSGGVALNCKANGTLLKKKIFDEIYVQPASGDAGGAVGAALYAHYLISGEPKKAQPFFGLGSSYGANEMKIFLDKNNIPYTDISLPDTLALTAGKIADGKIIAIFQGSMEFGPRALGFRSILADPRSELMKEKINAAVKFREKFRPFAPVVLAERAADYFDCQTESPYMLFNFNVLKEKRAEVPAITHIDNSSRIQTVNETDNAVLYQLISEFEKITSVPLLLNTSFNLRGHPIAESPLDAFATFCSGGIDFLLLEHYLVDKSDLSKEMIEKFLFEKSLD